MAEIAGRESVRPKFCPEEIKEEKNEMFGIKKKKKKNPQSGERTKKEKPNNCWLVCACAVAPLDGHVKKETAGH